MISFSHSSAVQIKRLIKRNAISNSLVIRGTNTVEGESGREMAERTKSAAARCAFGTNAGNKLTAGFIAPNEFVLAEVVVALSPRVECGTTQAQTQARSSNSSPKRASGLRPTRHPPDKHVFVRIADERLRILLCSIYRTTRTTIKRSKKMNSMQRRRRIINR